MVDFQREYLGKWLIPDEKYEMACNLWIDYFYLTEWYDQQICSGRTDEGIAMPIGNYEYIRINKNANRLRKDLTEKAKRYEIGSDTMQKAKETVLQYSQQTINELYEHIHK